MLAAGTRLGSFEIGSLLGVGGMGEVYRARDERLGRDVAVKILPAMVAQDAERAARFEREARLLATLNHPNIAAIYGVEESNGLRALVLELVEGDTLADLIHRGPVPAGEVVRIAGQLIDAIDAAHERGVIHRDLKPANIKITDQGAIKVLDFGLAKAIAEPGATAEADQSATVTHGATRDGAIRGTAAYMSPEQARGRTVDKRTDIWAFGCVLFELLTTHRPFDGASVSDVIVGVLEREPPWTTLPADTPGGLRQLIRKCLDKDPRERLRDIADARLYLTDMPAGASTAPAGPDAPTIKSLPRVAMMWALAGALAAVAGMQLWSRWPRTEVPSFPRVARIVATSANEFGPAISPDGKWIAYLSDARGPTDIWVKFIAGGDPVNLTSALDLRIQAQDNVNGLQISPDGSLIAFGASGPSRELSSWVMPVPLGGAPRRVLETGSQAMTWSPDGRRVAFMRLGGAAGDSVWVADADGQHPREIVVPHGGRHTHWLRWSHDGRFVYFNYGPQAFNTEPTQIARVAAAGGSLEVVVHASRRAVYPFLDLQGRGLFYSANPDTVEMGLWWRDLASGRDYRLTNGLGDYAAPSVSADGSRLVASTSAARQYIARVDVEAPAQALSPLTDALSGDLDPAWSADGTRVAFSSLRGGNRNIWLAHADFSSAAPLTFGAAIDEFPAFSPDGREVAFVSDREGQRGVWLVSLEGRSPRLLAATDVLGAVGWSPDGRHLVCSQATGNLPALAIIDRATGNMRSLAVPNAASGPAWSPNQDLIAYLETQPGRGSLLRFIDPDGHPVPLPSNQSEILVGNGSVAWSRDGTRIAFTSFPSVGRSVLRVLTVRGGTPTRDVFDIPTSTTARSLAWTPDGRGLLLGLVTRTGDVMLAERAR